MPKPPVILVGLTPPPYTGVTVMTEDLADALHTLEIPVVHVGRSSVPTLQRLLRPRLIDRLEVWRTLGSFLLALLDLAPRLGGSPQPPSPWTIGLDCLFLGLARLRGFRTALHVHGPHRAHLSRTARGPHAFFCAGAPLGRYALGAHAASARRVSSTYPLSRIHVLTNGGA